MDRLIKIDATAVSHAGMGYSDNENNFFINGRHMYEFEMDNIQVSIDNQDGEYIFAVSDGMDRVSNEKSTSISMMKELKKFQKKIRGTGGDLVSKLLQMKEKVEEVNNIIYSMGIGSPQSREKATAFSGIFILDGKVAALSSGRCKAYLLRDENMRLLTGESKKAERLLKMGIITNEQAKALTGKVAMGNGDGNTELHKSDIMDIQLGDVLLICSEGITNTLDDEKIHEIISMKKDSGYIANLLIKEALKNGEKSSITALVVRVKNADSGTGIIEGREMQSFRKKHKQSASQKNENARTIVAAIAACIIVIGILSIVFYKAWLPDKSQEKVTDSAVTTEQTSTTSTDMEDDKQELTDGENTDDQLADESEEQKNNTDEKAAQENEEVSSSQTNDMGETKHVVKSGDTLQKISKKYYGDMEKYSIIMEKNGITNPNSLQIGQELIIPAIE